MSDDSTTESKPAEPSGTASQKQNEVELKAGNLSVRAKGTEATGALMSEASEQMAEQMEQWVEVDRRVVSRAPQDFFF